MIKKDVYTIRIISEINESYQNRYKELIDFFNFVKELENDSIKNTIQKSYVLILYANWEGFIKETCLKYFKFVTNQKKQVEKLKPNFYNIYFKNLLKNYEPSRNINSEEKLLKKILNSENIFDIKLDDPFFVKYILGINSNLKIDNYNNLCKLVNYNLEDSTGIFNLNLQRLVHNRNSIAHTGLRAEENTYNDIEDISEMNTKIIAEMENFKNYIIDNIENKKYLI